MFHDDPMASVHSVGPVGNPPAVLSCYQNACPTGQLPDIGVGSRNAEFARAN